jgi:hypothetical protein
LKIRYKIDTDDNFPEDYRGEFLTIPEVFWLSVLLIFITYGKPFAGVSLYQQVRICFNSTLSHDINLTA